MDKTRFNSFEIRGRFVDVNDTLRFWVISSTASCADDGFKVFIQAK